MLAEELRANSLTDQAQPISYYYPQLPKGAEHHSQALQTGGGKAKGISENHDTRLRATRSMTLQISAKDNEVEAAACHEPYCVLHRHSSLMTVTDMPPFQMR